MLKKIIVIQFTFCLIQISLIAQDCNQSIYSIKVNDLNGDTINMDKYREKIVLIMFVPTFDLDTIRMNLLKSFYNDIKDKGLEVLIIPKTNYDKNISKNKIKSKRFDDSLEYNTMELNYSFQFCKIMKKDYYKNYELMNFLINHKYIYSISFYSDYHSVIINRNGSFLITYDDSVKLELIFQDIEKILDMNEED